MNCFNVFRKYTEIPPLWRPLFTPAGVFVQRYEHYRILQCQG